jgi:hypothetical protein
MKKCMLPFFMLFFISVTAQVTKDDVNLVQAMYGKDKRDLMQAYMQFKDTASERVFWKTYDAYEVERKKLGARYFNILQSYADNYEKLTNQKADELAGRMLTNNLEFENLYKKYFAKMKMSVGALKASQFLQLEIYLRNAVKVRFASQIPFIGEIDRSKIPNK